MNVLVDTCVWSQALRRRNSKPNQWTVTLSRLIRQGHVALIGPIRQEILSGVREAAQYNRLCDILRNFPDNALQSVDYERAAEMFNLCRRNGIQGSNTDFLICAFAEHHALSILTMDKDFDAFAEVLPIHLARVD